MKEIPEVLLKTVAAIALEQRSITDYNWWVAQKVIPLFDLGNTNAKYGKTEEERRVFWSRVIIDKEYELFMEKFPEKQEVVIDNQIFMI